LFDNEKLIAWGPDTYQQYLNANISLATANIVSEQ
jgi:hypothetical protein